MEKQQILIVDDDAAVLNLVAAVLQKHGYSVSTASDGHEGFELIRAAPQRFALLLTDITMPGKNGYELIRDVRTLALKLPIVAMTGYPGMEGDILHGVEVLAKPFKSSELVLTIEKHLKCSGPQLTSISYPSKRPELMGILVRDLAQAGAIYAQSQREFQETVAGIPSAATDPDRTLIVQNARNFESKAMKDYLRGLRELNDFALRGVIPARFRALGKPLNPCGKGEPSIRAFG